GGQREGFVERVGVQRVGAAEHRRERLDGGPHDVVDRLLGGQGNARGLRVEPQPERLLAGGAETSRNQRAQIRRAARNLAISSKKSMWASKKNDRPGAKTLTSRPRLLPSSTYPKPSARVNASSWAAVA